MLTEFGIAAILAASVWLLAATRSALVNQMIPVDNVALGTLAARTSLILETVLVSILSPFLVKRVRYFVKLHSVTTDEGPFIVGLAAGNATVGEITVALNEANSSGPEDISQSLTEDNAWVIWWNTVEKLLPVDSGGEAESAGEWHSLGKGMPALEAAGVKMFVANLDGTALTTGAEIQGFYQLQGVWLRG